ncbi:MAG TPA: Xaa-Pro peptidase family protein [Candidatus Nanoarchaeia archaeon]|nr:aminopeptidase YpdF [uncultured archaeon]
MQRSQSASSLATRLKTFRQKLTSKGLDAFLVSCQANRYYLTGWQGDSESGYLLVTERRAFILTDSRYTEEVGRRVEGFELVEYKGRLAEFLGNFFKNQELPWVGFESHDLSVFLFKEIKKHARGVKLVPVAHLLEDLRSVKDQEEIKLLKKSVEIADGAFAFIKNKVKVGMTEAEVAFEIEKFMRSKGAQKNAWEPFIVASGPNSSMVHYAAGGRELRKGDQVLLDWGCVYQGYFCDTSRVLFLGEPNAKQRQVYNLVLEAQSRGIAKVRAGRRALEVDRQARDFLKEKSKFVFGHGLGHGVGLEVHEAPRVNEHSTTKLASGQVITIEPGIYEPGWGGVRLEDMVLVTEKGCEVLTNAPKELEKVIVKV